MYIKHTRDNSGDLSAHKTRGTGRYLIQTSKIQAGKGGKASCCLRLSAEASPPPKEIAVMVHRMCHPRPSDKQTHGSISSALCRHSSVSIKRACDAHSKTCQDRCNCRACASVFIRLGFKHQRKVPASGRSHEAIDFITLQDTSQGKQHTGFGRTQGHPHISTLQE